ncbi:MAG: M23 family peptidase, partial [Arenimonas sp.]
MRLPFTVLFTLLLALPGLSAAAKTSDTRQQGAELTAAFYEQRIDAVWQRMSQQMQAALKSRDNLAAFRTQIGEQLGAETTVVEVKVDQADGYSIYQRRAHFEKVPKVILVQWA